MIDLIIYSKDRACQLNLLLESIDRYTNNIFNVTIIYTYSNELYKNGYDKINSKHTFIYQNDVNLDHITNFIISKTNNNYICFSTDDMVFYKLLPTKIKFLPKFDNEVFSFRLGYNTLLQDHTKGIYQNPLNIHVNKKGLLSWNVSFYRPDYNYGYPLAVDTHIFTKSLIQKLLANFEWKTTNELESKLQNYRKYVDILSSFEQSVSVNIPCNNMSNFTSAGYQYSYSLELLNDLWLKDNSISLDSISKTKIIGCHQEIQYDFNSSNR